MRVRSPGASLPHIRLSSARGGAVGGGPTPQQLAQPGQNWGPLRRACPASKFLVMPLTDFLIFWKHLTFFGLSTSPRRAPPLRPSGAGGQGNDSKN